MRGMYKMKKYLKNCFFALFLILISCQSEKQKDNISNDNLENLNKITKNIEYAKCSLDSGLFIVHNTKSHEMINIGYRSTYESFSIDGFLSPKLLIFGERKSKLYTSDTIVLTDFYILPMREELIEIHKLSNKPKSIIYVYELFERKIIEFLNNKYTIYKYSVKSPFVSCLGNYYWIPNYGIILIKSECSKLFTMLYDFNNSEDNKIIHYICRKLIEYEDNNNNLKKNIN